MKIKIFTTAIVLIASSCSLDIAPFDGITQNNLSSVPQTLEYATNGTYSLMKDQLEYKGAFDFRSTYSRNVHMMLEYASDNVTLSGATTDPLFFAATRDHYPAMENSTYVWYVGYKIISLANQNIESVTEGANVNDDQLLGENYFMRAVAYFDLLRLFARPYTHGIGNDGLPLRVQAATPDKLARATVGQCYDQLVADLLKAAELMEKGTPRGVEYGSKEAAWALLSRVYLYMEKNDEAIEYATKVINSPRFTLEPAATYLNLFHNTPGSAESIFVIKHLIQDDRGSGSIGSMYLTDNGAGWGEVYTSQPLYDLLQEHPDDVRNTLIKPQMNGAVVATRNGIPKYFITKFSYQDGIVTLSSPHVLRLSEMYLNRAEAHAKNGDDDLALADINVIRSRAGLSGADLYSLGDLQGAATVLDAVLQERRIELAYEGHRTSDVYRNKLDMDRTFMGVQPLKVISWEDDRNIYYIPQDELVVNNICRQNS